MYKVYLDIEGIAQDFAFSFETLIEATSFMNMMYKHYDDYESDYALIFIIAKSNK